MGRRVSRIAAAAATAAFVAGCAYNDHFDNRVDRFDIASEQARDRMILTNIVRASMAEPLAFQSLGQISGSNTTSLQLGLPSLVFGPKAALSAATRALDQQTVFGANPRASGALANGMTTSGSTSFNVTPSETQDFYQGLLEPVEPQTLALFKEQGVADEILFYLFTQQVSKSGKARPAKFNSSTTGSIRALKVFITTSNWRCGTDCPPNRRPAPNWAIRPRPTRRTSRASRAIEQQRFDERAGHGLAALFQPQGLGAGHALRRQPSPVRFERKDEGPSHRDVPRPQRETGDGARVSAFDLLDLPVSRTARRRRRRGPDPVGHRPGERARAARGRHALHGRLRAASLGGDCFLTVNYGGANYCVPTSALNTKRILGLLVQLLALNTRSATSASPSKCSCCRSSGMRWPNRTSSS